jgi:hypothetical protein
MEATRRHHRPEAEHEGSARDQKAHEGKGFGKRCQKDRSVCEFAVMGDKRQQGVEIIQHTLSSFLTGLHLFETALVPEG